MTGGSILQRTARPWLPPLSIATIIGVLLFCVYIGSAFFSSIDSMFFKTGETDDDSPPYSIEEESRYCQDYDMDDGRLTPQRMLYIQPSGSISNRMSAIATSLHVASTLGAQHMVVWNGREEYSNVFTEDWNDVFQASDFKALSFGCFPGGARSYHRAQCKVKEVRSMEEWQNLLLAQSQEGATWPLCVRSSISLAKEHHMEGMMQDDFLRTLKPTQSIINHVDRLKNKTKWHEWGYWVGIDADTHDQGTVENILRQFANIVREQKDGGSIRVVFMGSNSDTEVLVHKGLTSLYPDLSESGRFVSAASAIGQRPGDWARSDIAKILLQSACNVVITEKTLDECETAKYFGLERCLSV